MVFNFSELWQVVFNFSKLWHIILNIKYCLFWYATKCHSTVTIVKWPQDKLGQFSLLEWCSYILEKGDPIHMKKDLSAKKGKGVQVMIQPSNNNDSPIEALQTTSLPLRTIWLSTIMHPHFWIIMYIKGSDKMIFTCPWYRSCICWYNCGVCLYLWACASGWTSNLLGWPNGCLRSFLCLLLGFWHIWFSYTCMWALFWDPSVDMALFIYWCFILGFHHVGQWIDWTLATLGWRLDHSLMNMVQLGLDGALATGREVGLDWALMAGRWRLEGSCLTKSGLRIDHVLTIGNIQGITFQCSRLMWWCNWRIVGVQARGGLPRGEWWIVISIVIITTKLTGISIVFCIPLHIVGIPLHILSFIEVGIRVQYGVTVPACPALSLCIAVCMPWVIGVLSINTKVRHLGDCQLWGVKFLLQSLWQFSSNFSLPPSLITDYSTQRTMVTEQEVLTYNGCRCFLTKAHTSAEIPWSEAPGLQHIADTQGKSPQL